MIKRLVLAVLTAITFSLFAHTTIAQEKSPNVIIIFPDQMRQYSLGFWSQGENAKYIQGRPDPVNTPALDQLAKEGVVFSRAMSNFPLCSPFRGMLMTGRYPYSNGLTANCHKSRDTGIKVDGKALANIYAEAGYETAYFGKCHWHRTEPAFDEKGTYQGTTEAPGGYYINAYDTYVPNGPARLGFDYFFQTLRDTHNDPLCYSNDPKAIGGLKDGEQYIPHRFNAELESETITHYLDNSHGQRDPDKPFFITWALNPPHNPWTEESTDMRFFPQYTDQGEARINNLLLRENADKKIGNYAPYYFANVSAVDYYIGKVLDKLDEIGETDHTVILFTSDHGEMLGSHGRTGKLTPYSEAFNIPFIIKYGSKLQHRVEDLILSVPDIMPTILALSGLEDKIPETVQGTNYAEIIRNTGTGKEKKTEGALYFDYKARGLYTGNYTFIVQAKEDGKTFQEAYYYDNQKDPYQLHKIAGDEMDKELVRQWKKELVVRLKAINDRWAQNKICSEYLDYAALIDSQKFNSTTEEKLKFIADKRDYFAHHTFRGNMTDEVESVEQCIDLLNDEGYFTDTYFLKENWSSLNKANSKQQKIIGDALEKSFLRLWKLAELFRNNKMPGEDAIGLRNRIFKGFINYRNLEADRPEDVGRFHQSCFAMPRCAINSYFCFFDTMEKIERGIITEPILMEGRKAMVEIGFQAWTKPKREDETDKNVVSIDRFRKHVWWVGGNGLAYRNLFECAAMMSSIEMMDVIAAVSKGSISVVSQTTYDQAFWTEGMTADGAGWGHGKQNLVWGYPVHGVSAALDNLNKFKGSPWGQKLDRDNVKWLLNFLRGSAFFYHKGITPPCLDRGSMAWNDLKRTEIPSLRIVDNLLENWSDSFSSEELDELKQFKSEAENREIKMRNYGDGNYHGTRYFFNNDNFAKKTEDYYALITMASIRCDGIESAHTMADRLNLFTCDGMTLFQRSGDESRLALGAWNLTAAPGITGRQVDRLHAITNWRGFCSAHNFAAGATHGGENGVTGFIFEKLNASAKEDVNDKTGLNEMNPDIYGVQAYKGYFWFGDLMLALGAGVSDLKKNIEKPVWTSIEQTIARGDKTVNGEPVKVSAKKQSIHVTKENNHYLKWITNNGFAYAALPDYTDGEIYYTFETRPTHWDSLNFSNRKTDREPAQLEIFHMWIDHGNHPENQSYAYLVNCNPGAQVSIPEVISNSTRLQAAVSSNGKIIEAIFYDRKSKLNIGDTWFKVSAECAFMMEEKKNTYIFTVCDAKMDINLDELYIETNLAVKGENIINLGKMNRLIIQLPKEPFRGKPVSVEVHK